MFIISAIVAAEGDRDVLDGERDVDTYYTLGFGGEITKGIQLFEKLVVAGMRSGPVIQAIAYARSLAIRFALFRGPQKIDENMLRYMYILREAASGAERRAWFRRTPFDTVPDGVNRSFPELYKLNRLTHEEDIALFGLGTATREEAQALGEAFVGPGFRRSSDPTKYVLISEDGRRVYRGPEFKADMNREQANFDLFPGPNVKDRHILSNGHLDITP